MALGFSSSSSLKERRLRAACERSATRGLEVGAQRRVGRRDVGQPVHRQLARTPPPAGRRPGCAAARAAPSATVCARCRPAACIDCSVGGGLALHQADRLGRDGQRLARLDAGQLAAPWRRRRARACALSRCCCTDTSVVAQLLHGLAHVGHRVAQRQVGHLVDQGAEAFGRRRYLGHAGAAEQRGRRVGQEVEVDRLLAGDDALRRQPGAQAALHQHRQVERLVRGVAREVQRAGLQLQRHRDRGLAARPASIWMPMSVTWPTVTPRKVTGAPTDRPLTLPW